MKPCDLGSNTADDAGQNLRVSLMIPSAVYLCPVPYPQVNNVDSSTTSTSAANKAQSGLLVSALALQSRITPNDPPVHIKQWGGETEADVEGPITEDKHLYSCLVCDQSLLETQTNRNDIYSDGYGKQGGDLKGPDPRLLPA